MKKKIHLNVVGLLGLKLFIFIVIFCTGYFVFEIVTRGFYCCLGALFGFTSLSLIIFRKHWIQEQTQSIIQITTDIALENILIHFSGGVESPFIFLLIFDLFLGALLLPEKKMIFLSVYVAIFYAGFNMLTYSNLLPTILMIENKFVISQDLYFYYLLYMRVFIFLMIGYLAAQLSGRIYFQKVTIEQIRQLTENILFQMGSGLITIDDLGKIIYSNKSAADILGYSNTELLSKTWKNFFLSEEKNAEKDLLFQHNALEGTEFQVTRPDGKRIFVGVSSSAFKATDAPLLGKTLVFRDITVHKELEMLRAEQKKIKTLGELAANMAHEIKNPLASICGSLEVLVESSHFEDESSRKLINIVFKESERLSRTLTDFLVFAGDIPLRKQEHDLVPLIEEVFLILEHSTERKPSIVLKKNIPIGQDFRALTDGDAFKQILINLILNGMQSIQGGNGTIQVSLNTVYEEGKRKCQLDVSDTGSGIMEKHRKEIFKPFFSTRIKGIGLGLHVCRQIVEKLNWQISFHSKTGQGTVFSISIPSL
jgi:two-component system sensor histidine kinase PilS (NtrC family)